MSEEKETQHAIVQQVVGQLHGIDNELFNVFFLVPWRHHVRIIDKCSEIPEAIFYLKKTVQNNWSRDTLLAEIKGNLYERQGKAITNFEWTLPKPQSDLALETFKNPYNFEPPRLTQAKRGDLFHISQKQHFRRPFSTHLNPFLHFPVWRLLSQWLLFPKATLMGAARVM